MKIEKPIIALVISVFSVSTAAILIISIKTNPYLISFYRLLFTTSLLIPLILIQKKYQDEIKNLSRKTFILMLGIGIILALHFTFWIKSLTLTSVASSVILVTVHPIFVGPIAHFVLKEKLSIRSIIGISLSFFGIIILVYGNYGISTISIDSLEGNILAFLGGIAAGLYIMGGRYLRQKISVVTYAFIVYCCATFVLLLFCIIANVSVFNISTNEIGIILLIALIPGIFGHTLYNWSLAKIRASVVSVALLGEPIGSAMFAYYLPWINQVPSKFTIIGGSIILFGIFLTAYKKQKIESNPSL
jgi:drug/metabolite transporter (DMT)-like permease